MPSFTISRRIPAAVGALAIFATLAFSAPAIADETPPDDTTAVDQTAEVVAPPADEVVPDETAPAEAAPVETEPAFFTAQALVDPAAIECVPIAGWATEDVAPVKTAAGLVFDGPSVPAVNYYQRVSAGNAQGLTGMSYTIAPGSTGYVAEMKVEVNPNADLGSGVIHYATLSTIGNPTTGVIDAQNGLWYTSKIAYAQPGGMGDPLSWDALIALMPNNTLLSAPSLHLLSNSPADAHSVVTSVTSSCGTTDFTTELAAAPVQIAPANKSIVASHDFPMSWNDFGAGYTYEIYSTTNDPGTATVITDPIGGGLAGLSNPYQIAGVPDAVYWWQVRAIDPNGYAGAWSTIWKVTVDTTAVQCVPIAGWTPEDAAPVQTAAGLVFDGPSVPAVNYYQRVSAGNAQGLTGMSYTIAPGSTGYVAELKVEVNPNADLGSGVIHYATLSTIGNPTTGVIDAQNGLWYTSKIAYAAPGGMGNPLPWDSLVALMPNNTLLSAPSLHLLSNSPAGAHSVVTSVTSSCGTTDFTTAPTGAPTILTPTDGYVGTSSEIDATWTTVVGADSYETRVADNQAMTQNLTGPFGGLQTPLHTTVAEGTFWFQVRAVNSHGAGPWSTSSKFTTDVTAPTVTNEVQVWQATQNGRISVTLTFSEPIKATLGQGWYGSGTTWNKVYYTTASHVLSFQDLAGNSNTYTLNVDASAPSVPTSLSPNGWTVASDTFTWATSTDAHPVKYEVALGNHPNLVGGPGTAMSSGFQSLGITPTNSLHYVLPTGPTFWQVRAIDSVGNVSAWTAPAGASVIGVPVLTSTSTDPLTGDLDVSWTSIYGIGGLDGYQVEYTLGDGSTVVHTVTGLTDTQTASPANQGTVSVRVRGVYAIGFTAGVPESKLGVWSNVLNFTRDSIGPDAPQPFNPSNGGTFATLTPTLVWLASTDAVKYQVRTSTDAGTTGGELNGGEAVTLATTTLLTQSVTAPRDGYFFWQVRAIDGLGNVGPWSNVWGMRLDTTAPVAPQPFNPSNGNTFDSRTQTLTWLTTADAAKYQVQWSTSPSRTAGALDGTDLTVFPTTAGLTQPITAGADGYVFWQVRAIDSVGNVGPWSSIWSFIADTTGPDAVTLTAPANASTQLPGAVTFAWNSVADAAAYYIEVSDSAGVDADGFFLSTLNDATVSDAFADATAAAGTYYWHVVAVDSVGNLSAWSSTFAVTFAVPVAPPAAPADPAAPAAAPAAPAAPAVTFAAPAAPAAAVVTPPTAPATTTTDDTTAADDTTADDQLPTEAFDGQPTAGDAPWWPWAVGAAILLILALLWLLVFRKRFGNQS